MIGLLILLASVDYFMDQPSYHWITVSPVSEGTWTDGVSTWIGLPGCKAAGMPISDECKSLELVPNAPAELIVS